MHDHLKAAASLAMLLGVVAAIVGLVLAMGPPLPQPFRALKWLIASAGPVMIVCGALLLWRLSHRPDEAPDFLRSMFKDQFRRPFEAGGVCFVVIPESGGGVAELHIFFQNRWEAPCQARITIRRDHGFAWSHKKMEIATVRFWCEGGSFGLVRVPIGVPRALQGKRKRLAASASVGYPQGRGRMIRFKAGKRVGSGDIGAGTIAAAHLLGGVAGAAMAAHQAAGQFRMTYPAGVAEEVPPDAEVAVETLWRPGDPVGGLDAEGQTT